MALKIYSLDSHGITKDRVDPDALYVMEKLRSHGYTAYLVGGGVRDLLLNHKPKDFDISTSAKPDEIRQLFRNCILIGRRFRLAHIRFGKKVIEVSTFRSGDNDADALILRDNQWGTPEEDVLRRDFTINGLFYDPNKEELIDYVDGYPDVKKELLRTIGQPFIRFRQDPVRMLRLLKFQARFGFQIDPSAHAALVECRKEILKSSSARILEELLRMLESGASEAFIRLLREHGFFDLIIPPLGESLAENQEAHMYAFLKEADLSMKDPTSSPCSRSVLLSCLVYPMFESRMQTHYGTPPFPHLGKVAEEAHNLVNEFFQPFLHLSRKIKSHLITILTSQYRFTPFEQKRKRRIRIPHDPDFPLALDFLQMRASLEPALQTTVQEWMQTGDKETSPPPSRRRRRPRRRHPPTPDG